MRPVEKKYYGLYPTLIKELGLDKWDKPMMEKIDKMGLSPLPPIEETIFRLILEQRFYKLNVFDKTRLDLLMFFTTNPQTISDYLKSHCKNYDEAINRAINEFKKTFWHSSASTFINKK